MSDFFALSIYLHLFSPKKTKRAPLILAPPTVQLIEMFKGDLNGWQNTVSEFLVWSHEGVLEKYECQPLKNA